MSHVSTIRQLRPVDIYKEHKSNIDEAGFKALCKGAPIWHSVDLGDVFIEGARKTSAVLAKEMQCAGLPDLRGKSVLDIGAFTGWYSFEAERRGASEVVALDYHSWALKWPELMAYMSAERAAGRIGDPYHPPASMIDEINQPGRAVFDLTRRLLNSKVQTALSRVEDYNPGRKFDVVLYLGVLYHCEDPMLSLKKVASLTN